MNLIQCGIILVELTWSRFPEAWTAHASTSQRNKMHCEVRLRFGFPLKIRPIFQNPIWMIASIGPRAITGCGGIDTCIEPLRHASRRNGGRVRRNKSGNLLNAEDAFRGVK
jgi:hypothetical protein